jgi:hypothetical protein
MECPLTLSTTTVEKDGFHVLIYNIFWFSKYLKHIMYLGSATHIVVQFTIPNSV